MICPTGPAFPMTMLTKKPFLTASVVVLATQFTALAATPAYAQQMIRNTASASWTVDGKPVSVASNEVSVLTSIPASPPEITIYRFGSAAGGITAPVAPTKCSASGGDQILTPKGAFEGVATNPATLIPETDFIAGTPVVIGITALSANRDKTVRETLDVVVTTANGDREAVTLTESAANSGHFLGMINSSRMPPALKQGRLHPVG